MHETGVSKWNRRNYPLQASTKGSTLQYLSSASSDVAASPSSYASFDNDRARHGSIPAYSDIYRSRSSSEDPVPTYSLISTREVERNPLPDHHRDMASAAPATNPWTRCAYPLQAVTEGSTPQHQPIAKHEEEKTRPLVSMNKNTPAIVQRSDNMNQSTYVHRPEQWSRRKYPVQLVTHGSVPQSLQNRPPEEKKMPDANQVPKHNEDEIPKGTTPWNRRVYPLQSSREAPPVSGLPTPPPSRSGSTDLKPSQPPKLEEHSTPQKSSPSWNRQQYPLQHTVSKSKVQQSPESQSEAQLENLNESSALPPSDRQNQVKDERASAWKRQTHPLQGTGRELTAQDTTPALPSPEILERKEDPDPEIVQNEGHIQAIKKETAWQRQVYPLQSDKAETRVKPSVNMQTSPQGSMAEDKLPPELLQRRQSQLSPFQRRFYAMQSTARDTSPPPLPTPPPSDEEYTAPKLEQAGTSSPVHLPRNIRAVKNADKVDRDGRTIVVCLDGTGDKFDNDNSNIVHLVSSLKKDDPAQVTYYQAGIGTYSDGGLSSGFSAALDMAVGSELGLHVRDAYHFLMHTYKEGDKICIFGFSRGAYTARCLAGMIHKVGLLPPRNTQQIAFAYEFYANDTPEGWKQSADFKKTFCIDVSVYFLGVFDSVDSVGFIPRRLPLSSTPTSKPHYFRHAMALDERRAKFKICRHQTRSWDDIDKPNEGVIAKLVHSATNMLPGYKILSDVPPDHAQRKTNQHGFSDITDAEYASLTTDDNPRETDVLEVWFLGAHADVGGGAVPNDERHKLSHIPLRWIIRQCFECNTGIIFKTKMLAEHGLDVHTLWPQYQPLNAPHHIPSPSLLEKYEEGLPDRSIRRSKLVPIQKGEGENFYGLNIFDKNRKAVDDEWTPEHLEDFFDAMSPLNDQLIDAPVWWILEVWPVSFKMPKEDSQDFYVKVGMNLGRYRAIEDHQPKMHWTVSHRMQHKGYKIQARTNGHPPWQTVA